jgi:hypothetical protein
MVNFNHAALANFASAAALLAGVATAQPQTQRRRAQVNAPHRVRAAERAQAQSGDIVSNAGGGSRVGSGLV